jgi:hypothetical protein
MIASALPVRSVVPCARASSRLTRNASDDELVCYPAAGHGIGLPGMPTTDLVLEHPIFHELMMLGGTPAGTAHAQRDGTERIVTFLDRALGPSAGQTR